MSFCTRAPTWRLLSVSGTLHLPQRVLSSRGARLMLISTFRLLLANYCYLMLSLASTSADAISNVYTSANICANDSRANANSRCPYRGLQTWRFVVRGRIPKWPLAGIGMWYEVDSKL